MSHVSYLAGNRYLVKSLLFNVSCLEARGYKFIEFIACCRLLHNLWSQNIQISIKTHFSRIRVTSPHFFSLTPHLSEWSSDATLIRYLAPCFIKMTPSLKLHLFPIQILPTKEKGRLACTKSCHIIISHSRWARKWLDQKLSNTAEILRLKPDFPSDPPSLFLRYAMQVKLGMGCYLDCIIIMILYYLDVQFGWK